MDHFFRIYRWRSACINRPIILPVHGRRYHLLYNDNPDYTLSVSLIFAGVKTMIDRFSCKHNESNVNNDNEHDDYVEDDTDLSMMLFQKEN